ncbi:MAG: hypothetical protein GY751_14500 [Bacteroidetes bacterium]|nr:hypothetical protein [Bacteroidota bacterium]
MKATVDISLYPLNDTYRDIIVGFVLSLRKRTGISVETDSMSTQIVGDYDELMKILQEEMKAILEQTAAVFIIKLARGERTKENLTEALRL